ncbi:DUF116 domain-containing protein [Alkalicella caledoniensis]|uniref:DUF116 domain-containing protein n=1 Tax=Alkalicella caledoniensis TaxID=2731377 RepID=A0A7G9WCD2_ALKCA|nr:DUF116 domain-containing protein [Alkalicella caledoniensis]QNO16344.1 DUF116 domain-containing protein [Alkalicella caledoniensis]
MNTIYKKRIFIVLMILTVVVLMATMLIFWLGVNNDILAIKLIIWFVVALIIAFVSLFCLGTLMLVQGIFLKSKFAFFNPVIKGSIKMLYPLVMMFCKLLKLDEMQIKGSFIEINNQLLLNNKVKYLPEEILVLLPHCIQNASCTHKITHDIENCTQCGKCQIKDILIMSKKYKINVLVATGGTIARRKIKELKPKAVMAVACERDLTSGIIDCEPLPVIGVINIRPNGPCFNTGVNLDEFKIGLESLLKEEI